MEALHLKVSLFQQDTDSSSWNHTRMVAVPVVAPDGMPEHHNNRRLADFCNRDKQQQVPQAEQNTTAPDNARVQDNNSPVQMAPRVVCVRVCRVELSVAYPGLMQVCRLVDERPVYRQLAG